MLVNLVKMALAVLLITSVGYAAQTVLVTNSWLAQKVTEVLMDVTAGRVESLKTTSDKP